MDALAIGILVALLAAAATVGLTLALQRRGERLAAVDVADHHAGSLEASGPALLANQPDRDVDADLAAVAELAGPGLLRVSPTLTVLAANEAAHRLFVRRPGSMTGRSLIEATADHRLEEVARTALQAGSATGEVALRTPAGSTVAVRARRVPDGGAWLALEDVSELRRLQRIRSEFIDNLSHELRTPLTSVSLLAETLARDAASLPPRVAERVTKIEVETGHLVQMVNELLELSRIESGRAPLSIAPVDVGRLVTSTVARLALFADRQGVRFEVDAGPPDVVIRADGERLGQALLNLLHNAVKFSTPGGLVRVSVEKDGNQVVIAVADHGAGIPRDALPRIFERFYKVDRARTLGGGGTGLGLSISRHIVEAHGGRIWAESEVGAGSTFRFAVPMGGPPPAEASGA